MQFSYGKNCRLTLRWPNFTSSALLYIVRRASVEGKRGLYRSASVISTRVSQVSKPSDTSLSRYCSRPSRDRIRPKSVMYATKAPNRATLLISSDIRFVSVDSGHLRYLTRRSWLWPCHVKARRRGILTRERYKRQAAFTRSYWPWSLLS